MNVLVSSCLLGLDCRYCGAGCYNEQVIMLKQKHNLIPVCPEQMGGLPTPRPPVELVNGQAVDSTGVDYTLQFEKGADEVVKLAKIFNCTFSILKNGSPSCGSGLIYDGTFSGKLINGNGITVIRLQKEGITVANEINLSEWLNTLQA